MSELVLRSGMYCGYCGKLYPVRPCDVFVCNACNDEVNAIVRDEAMRNAASLYQTGATWRPPWMDILDRLTAPR